MWAWANVLLLREMERRLTADELAAARPLVGLLQVDVGHERWDMRRGQRLRSALLYDPTSTRTLAQLHRVQLLKLSGQGMVLAGVEEVFTDRGKESWVYRQAWWCWPAGLAPPGQLSKTQPDHELPQTCNLTEIA